MISSDLAATPDIVRELGYLALGTRLKRVGEKLQAHTQRILEAHGLEIPAGHFPFLAALDRLGPLTIGELAEAVGVTQPGATRTAAQLEELGLIAIAASTEDRRRKRVTLTGEGSRLIATAKRTAWPLVERAVEDLCRRLGGSLLDQLAGVEDGLAAEPLERRVGGNRRKQR